jgi:hypothetical protein
MCSASAVSHHTPDAPTLNPPSAKTAITTPSGSPPPNAATEAL